MRAGIIVASDKGARGERVDESGKVIASILKEHGYTMIDRRVIADEQDQLAAAMRELADVERVDLVLTTGGTGFSRRDVTPEATLSVIERIVPGIPEAMRALSMAITPRAMLSRATAGIRGGTLIVNLPGSPKAVRECLDLILEPMAHGLEILSGEASECAR